MLELYFVHFTPMVPKLNVTAPPFHFSDNFGVLLVIHMNQIYRPTRLHIFFQVSIFPPGGNAHAPSPNFWKSYLKCNFYIEVLHISDTKTYTTTRVCLVNLSISKKFYRKTLKLNYLTIHTATVRTENSIC